MSHIIGIDIGTSGIKVGLMDKNGDLISTVKQSYSLLYPKNGWVEINADKVWKITERLIEKSFQKIREIGGEADAISLSSFCNSSILIDNNGSALSNGIMYLDKRSEKQAIRVQKLIGKELLYDITRNRIEPGMFAVSSLIWSRENLPELYNKTYKWGNLSTYIFSKLTGNFVMDWTQASFSGIFDTLNYKWSSNLCSKMKIDETMLPKIVSPFARVGEYKQVPVIAGAADTACSSLALNIKPNDIFESVGTSDVLTVCTDDPDYLDTRFLNRCHVWENQWLSHGAMSTPGASIKWFNNTFLQKDECGKNTLENLPKQSEIGANGVFFLPYMQGERTPIWNPNARGVFIGMHLNTTKADMFRSILEGASYGLKQISEIVEKDYKLDFYSLQSIGGASKNKTWAQIKANILKKEIQIKEINETGVYGSCLIAGQTIGYFSTIQEILDSKKNRTIDSIKPDPETFPIYDKKYHDFNQIYPALKNFFK